MNFSKYKHLDTDDFQKRDGDYPRSGIPDTISVWDNEIELSFKNTSEFIASKWTKSWLIQNSINYSEISSYQDGDYHDDWVNVVVT